MKTAPSDGPTDRRVLRTRQLIADALLKLSLEKPFADIIVKDITETANVNRSTFYTHFRDKFDLLQHIAEDRLSELGRLASPAAAAKPYQPDFETPDPYFVALFEHLASNETFYRIVLTRLDDPALVGRMQEVVRESFYARITGVQPSQKLQVPLDILLDYTSCSMMGIIRNWFEQRMIYSSHYMALQMTRMSVLGFYEAMGYDRQSS